MNNQSIQLQLQFDALLNIPFNTYEEDFIFIVNHKEFKTSRIISDLLSPKISQEHLIDPTISTFVINTKHEGDFSYIFNLIKFQQELIPENGFLFIKEVLKILDNKWIKIILPKISNDLSIDKAIDILEIHSKNYSIYSEYIEEEINFISSHFYELEEEDEEKLTKLDLFTITQIFDNPILEIRDENQILKIVNKLYLNDQNYSILYERVYFENVEETEMNEFINIFDYNDMTSEIWTNISARLKHKIENDKKSETTDNQPKPKQHNYKEKRNKNQEGLVFVNKNENEFDGIINHLRKESNYNIRNLIEITSSSSFGLSYSPYNVCMFEESNKFFKSKNLENSWICFDFKDHQIIPSSYVIKSYNYGENGFNPKSWIVEGSNDNLTYEKIDEVINNSDLNGSCFVHKFDIFNQTNNAFRYIRIRQTSVNWNDWNHHFFVLGSVEFYGTLI